MIESFEDELTRLCFEGQRVHGVGWEQVQKVARRKLMMLHAAVALNDLKAPPGNQLESLKEDRAGQHAIRINDQWRVCFRWTDGNAFAVEITDYH